ncbi:uncharacterized protein LOC105689858 isoform X1 [Athalia rosae]|uniref:uncharacterized protein LOC105689858 isoform X1 n=1 Tax=Athalia rosae TaxID=37344 RepID=UPI002033A9EC|nr:uncharacterized protein LOC105689858 isoform X1 [Athalia rosae]XP_012262622.2 uncharacterized protein LOC105689858 isoform X1 [Athalia rosae]XP_048508434.1 uncharacterized protein LOC105689858 isoform X1 [Athalia rosae]
MSLDWTEIGQKVALLYEEMEYHCEYSIEHFMDDLKIAKNKKVFVPKCRPEDESTGYLRYSKWLLSFRYVIECHRSILTKLFSFTDYLSGVDMLVEYCDYYRSYYEHKSNHIPVVLPVNPGQMLYEIFKLIARTETTIRHDAWQHVWLMLLDLMGLSEDNVISSVETYGNNIFTIGSESAIVIMADSDLYAVVEAIMRFSSNLNFKLTKFFIQEPVEKQFFSTLQKNEFRNHTPPLDTAVLSSLYLFRNIAEVIGSLNGQKNKLSTVSVWSENLIAAKKLAANIEIGTVWINTHGQLSAGLHSIIYSLPPCDAGDLWTWNPENDIDDKCPIATRTIDLFYGGKWHTPDEGTYWTNKSGVAYAEATRKDFISCVNAARKGFKSWHSMKLSERVKVIRCFAERLFANGELELGDLVMELVNLPHEFGHSISIVRDGEVEILTTQEPSGVVLIFSAIKSMLFTKLIIAAVTGNTVIVASDTGCDSIFAGYCDMLTSSGFPPGVVNYLFARNSASLRDSRKLVDRVLTNSCEFLDFKFSKPQEEYFTRKIIFAQVTKPKSIWVQCG